MRHLALPESMTVEQLAQWITTNNAEKINHEEKVELTPEAINELEHKSSLASRKIDELKEVENLFKSYLKKGTEVDLSQINENTGEPMRLPQEIVIPPTKGLDELNANRQWADKQLREGYKTEVTTLYVIPWPEGRLMVAVDIEGKEWESYTRDMTDDESKKYGELFQGKPKKSKKKVQVEEEEQEGEAFI